MAHKKIRCKLFRNTYEYGGGHWYLPAKYAEEIKRRFLSNQPIAKESDGIFDFDVAYLDLAFSFMEEDGFFWWDGTWME